MLLGTYQSIHMAGCNENLRKSVYQVVSDALGDTSADEFGRAWDERGTLADECVALLGIDPVWCFPCRDPKEAFVQSCLSSPNCADLFFLIDTDDYVKIDRVKWEGHIRARTSLAEALAGCIAPDLDDSVCDFLVDRSRLGTFALACLPAYVTGGLYLSADASGLWFFREGGADSFLWMEVLERHTPGITALFRTAGAELSRIRRGSLSVPDGVEMDGARRSYMLQTKYEKDLFECSALSALVGLVQSGFTGFEVADFFRVVVGLSGVRSAALALAEWAEGPRDRVGYEAVMRGFGDCWCDEKAVLSHWLHGRSWPGRNDPCVCGSGKKFKKCCGRKYNLI